MAGQWKLNGTVPTVAPGYPAVVATSSPTRFDDHGIRFDVSDACRNGMPCSRPSPTSGPEP